ncbi:MAG: Bug family tripartite tricarboxylate transporter substrate binding protein [Burkholderiales bacterium]
MTRFLFALAALALSAALSAQPYPSRPVKIVAPFAPGGSADTLGRIVAQKLAEQLKESFVVENRAGAGGVVGSEFVSKSAPDGYTLVVSGIASHVIAPLLPGGTPYDPVKDFSHIALLGGPPAVFAVKPELPAKTLKEFIALAKGKPGKLTYGSPGPGTQGQLVAEFFKRLAGIDIVHVPYKGASQAVADLMGGQIDAVSTTLSTAAGQIRGGKARALALSAAQRLPDYKDIPTFAEQGFPDLVATVWFSLSGPAGMPVEIIDKLNAEVRRALETSEVREKLRPEGITPNRLDAKEFNAFLADEIRRWGPIVRTSGAKKD